MKTLTNGDLLTVSKAAKILDVSERTITRKILQGKFQATKQKNQKNLDTYMIDRQSFEEFKKNQETEQAKSTLFRQNVKRVEEETQKEVNKTTEGAVLSLWRDRIDELKTENKELKSELKDKESKLNELYFKSGALMSQLRLEGKTVNPDIQVVMPTDTTGSNETADDLKKDAFTDKKEKTDNKTKDDANVVLTSENALKEILWPLIVITFIILVVLGVMLAKKYLL